MPDAMTPEESFNAAMSEFEPAAPAEQTFEAPAEQVAVEPFDPPATQEAPAAPKINPSWEAAWEGVPEDVRQRQAAEFEKWDRNYEHLNTRFAPFREYEERGVDAALIQQALEIQQALVENPREFYDRIAQNWGFEQAQAVAAAVQQQQQVVEDDPYQSAENQQLLAMQQRLDAFEQAQLSTQQEQQQAIAKQQQLDYVENQLSELGTKVGDFDRNTVIERAILNATTGKNPSIANAYYEVKAQEDAILARVQRQAPRVLGGGAPAVSTPPVPSGPLSNEQLLAKAMAMAKATVESFNQQ